MSHPNPLYDRRRRRRRRHGPSASHHSPLTTLATAAAVAYGAYSLGSWAWGAYFGDDDDDDDDDGGNKDGNSDEEDGDIPREWTEDYRSAVRRDVRREEGFSSRESDDDDETEDEDSSSAPPGGGDDDGVHLRRSRRSRADWNAGRERSRRPSPAEGHRHHSPMKHEDEDEGSGGEGEGRAGAGGLATGGAKEAATGLGGAVGAGITAGIRAYNEKSNYPDAESVLEDQERRLRMGRCRLEASRAMTDFLPTLKRAIAKETNVSGETEGLKRLRIEKREIAEMREKNAENTGDVEEETDRIDGEEDEIRERERRLWNDIKTKSVTRLVATVYAHTIVFLVLTVQVNLLGGRLLREEREERELNGGRSANPTTTSGADRYRTSHQTVLARTYKYLFSRGIPLLAETAGAAVDEILRDWDVLDDDATLGDVSSWMESVRERMEHHDRKDEGTSPLVKFIIPPEGETDDAAAGGGGPDSHTHPDELAGYILDETYDLLESPAFADAERRCLDATFGQLRTNVLGRMFLLEDDVPLATVVTHFQKTAVTTFHRPPSHEEEMRGWGGVLGMMEEPLPSSVPNEYVSRLERLDAVLELSDVCF